MGRAWPKHFFLPRRLIEGENCAAKKEARIETLSAGRAVNLRQYLRTEDRNILQRKPNPTWKATQERQNSGVRNCLLCASKATDLCSKQRQHSQCVLHSEHWQQKETRRYRERTRSSQLNETQQLTHNLYYPIPPCLPTKRSRLHRLAGLAIPISMQILLCSTSSPSIRPKASSRHQRLSCKVGGPKNSSTRISRPAKNHE